MISKIFTEQRDSDEFRAGVAFVERGGWSSPTIAIEFAVDDKEAVEDGVVVSPCTSLDEQAGRAYAYWKWAEVKLGTRTALRILERIEKRNAAYRMEEQSW